MGPLAGRSSTDVLRDRGDAALDVAGEEHVPDCDRRRRFPRRALTEGEKIMLLFESANFDDAVFDAPRVLESTGNPTTISHLASARTSVWVINWPGAS